MYHQLNLLTIPPVVSGMAVICILAFYKWTIQSKRKKHWIALMAFFAVYAFIVGCAALEDINYQQELETFDLNHDGLFESNELNQEQEAAMFRLTSDVGRHLSVFGAVFFAAIAGAVVYLMMWWFEKYKRLKEDEEPAQRNLP